MESAVNETKIIYYVDDESIPYRIRIPVDSLTITLADIKSALLRPNCKYFFQKYGNVPIYHPFTKKAEKMR